MTLRHVGHGVAAAVLAVAGAASGQELPGASSDDHLWLVVPGTEADEMHLLHHARVMDGPWIKSQRKLRQVPERLAAWDDRVWIVLPPNGADQADPRRDVFTLQVVHNPALDAYFTTPTDRLGVAASLPGDAPLAGLAGTDLGPVALLTGDEPALRRLEGKTWRDLPLPPGFTGGRASRLVHATEALLILTATPDETATVVHRLGRDGDWSRIELGLDPGTLVGVTAVGGHPLVVRRDGDTLGLDYFRTRLLPLVRVDAPTDAWAVLGLADGPRLVSFDQAGTIHIQRVDPVSGATGAAEDATAPPLPANQVWHLSLLLAVAVTLFLIAVVFRPGSRAPLELPPDAAPLSPMTRLAALAVDLIPGALAAIAFYGAAPSDLIRAPLFAPDLSDASPYMIMVAVAVGHGAAFELVASRSLGKMLVGGRVVALDGRRPRLLLIVLRNVVKLLVLILPPLALLGLLNPYQQGVHDLMARTVVVGDRVAGEAPPAEDDSNR